MQQPVKLVLENTVYNQGCVDSIIRIRVQQLTGGLKYIEYRYIVTIMIRNFKSKVSQDVYDGVSRRYSRKIPEIFHLKIRRLFDQLNAAKKVETLRIPPSNRLEKLTGNLNGYWSLRINKQWRIIFKWKFNDAFDVDVVDYH